MLIIGVGLAGFIRHHEWIEIYDFIEIQKNLWITFLCVSICIRT